MGPRPRSGMNRRQRESPWVDAATILTQGVAVCPGAVLRTDTHAVVEIHVSFFQRQRFGDAKASARQETKEGLVHVRP